MKLFQNKAQVQILKQVKVQVFEMGLKLKNGTVLTIKNAKTYMLTRKNIESAFLVKSRFSSLIKSTLVAINAAAPGIGSPTK